MKKNNAGFSLIELLIVIAIIGIISSIVLSSLNSSRDKGYEAQIKQQLVQFRNAAEIYFYAQTPNTYTPSGDCDGGVFASLNSTEGKPGSLIDLGTMPPGVERRCSSTDRTYAVKISSYVDSNGYWCADSKGTLQFYTGAMNATTLCP